MAQALNFPFPLQKEEEVHLKRLLAEAAEDNGDGRAGYRVLRTIYLLGEQQVPDEPELHEIQSRLEEECFLTRHVSGGSLAVPLDSDGSGGSLVVPLETATIARAIQQQIGTLASHTIAHLLLRG